jgi:A/G-specific adenine glycosylase
LPAPRPRKALPRREVVVLLIECDGHVLLERRPVAGVWPGLLGLPELPVDADVPAAVTVRFGMTPTAVERLPHLTHVFTHFALEMRPARIVIDAWPPHLSQPSLEWLPRRLAADAGVPAPVRRLLLGANAPVA